LGLTAFLESFCLAMPASCFEGTTVHVGLPMP
jgi:hypothetical protein